MSLKLNLTPPSKSGIIIDIAPGIRRIIACNTSPFTFTGTCCYILGRGEVAIIDPGPIDGSILDNLLFSLKNEIVKHIIITHSHKDHSQSALLLREKTGAMIIGAAPHFYFRESENDEDAIFDGAIDWNYSPEKTVGEDDIIEGNEYYLRSLAVPGHTANHLAFLWEDKKILFSGDHVMGWSTTIIAPPDGAMAPYIASLQKLLELDDDLIYLPGHGGKINNPKIFVKDLIEHRLKREKQIINLLEQRPYTISELVTLIYVRIDPRLKSGAQLSVLAHLEDLSNRNIVGYDNSNKQAKTYYIL